MPTEIRLLGNEDLPALQRFLRGQPAGISMRGFLARNGVTPEHGVYVGELEQGEVVSVLAFLEGAFHLVAPGALESLLPLAGSSRPGEIHGFIGPVGQVERALAWLGAVDAPVMLRTRDELFHLRLENLSEPSSPGWSGLRCRLATAADVPLLTAWRHDFWSENMGAPPGERLTAMCQKQVEDEIALGVLHLLEDGGQPVSCASFVPALEDAVQLANVFTPPDLRSRKYGRAVTALSLRQARDRGVEVGILFTGVTNAPAQRAYRALGFESCGEVTTLVFSPPRPVTRG